MDKFVPGSIYVIKCCFFRERPENPPKVRITIKNPGICAAPWCGNSNPGGVSGWVYKGRDREIGAYTGQELGIGNLTIYKIGDVFGL